MDPFKIKFAPEAIVSVRYGVGVLWELFPTA